MANTTRNVAGMFKRPGRHVGLGPRVRKVTCEHVATTLSSSHLLHILALQAHEDEAMRSRPALRSDPPFWMAAASLILRAAVVWLELIVPDAMAGTHEATEFSVPAGSPDEYMQAAAAFARELDPSVEISFWDSQSGSLSVSRIEGHRVKCILRASPDMGEALKPLGRFLNGRIEPQAQAMFPMAHEVAHGKLLTAFRNP